MGIQKSVVNSERFSKGLMFKDFVSQVTVNKDRFEEYYKTGQLAPDDALFFHKATQSPNGLGKMIVIGEEWCPDVFRGLPVMARIAEATGIELRIFLRDKNLDIMNEFLKEGKYQSIPVCVFYTKDVKYIAHWIERPVLADEERAKIEAEIKKQLPSASEQELRNATRERTQARYPAWQQATIQEMKKLLGEKLKI